MIESFYSRFESRFRGTREAVKKRQSVYLPLLNALKQLGSPPTLLDLGCGRGEWLELAQEAGWSVFGVDLDQGMLAEAARLGLHVRQTDLLEHLQEQADASLCAVTAFHLVEHLSFPDLLTLLSQIHRVLRPGGVMILETPNPENLAVASNSFHLDPTHRKPLPSELLSFLAEESGFSHNAVIRLHAPPDFSPAAISMQGLLYGVSPDYAVVAQKGVAASLLPGLIWPPSLEQGCSLFEAAASYDYSLHRHLDGIRAQQQEQIGKLRETMELQAWQQLEKILQVERRHDELIGQVERRQQESLNALSARVEGLAVCRQELQQVYASRSWRLTLPLRGFSTLLRRGKEGVLRTFRRRAGFSSGHEQQGSEPSQVPPTIAPEAEILLAPEAVSPAPARPVIEESEVVPASEEVQGENTLERQRELFVSRETGLYEKMKIASDQRER